MTGNEIRQKYLEFFKSKGHVEIPPSPLIPENDPTTLFTSSGMQPLVPYLLGKTHPSGKRLTDSQPAFRAQDIEEVGDNRHTTFFEMLGNWSLGDYFKKEQLPQIWEFLTQEIGLDPHKLYVTVFSGDSQTHLSRDEESIKIWKDIFSKSNIKAEYVDLDTEQAGYEKGMQEGRIFGYGVKKNWWSRSGIPSAMPAGEPGGPDSEVFYDFGTPHDKKFGENCHVNCDCGRFVELGNSVFMQYKKLEDGSLEELSQKNVDFGGGLERITAASNSDPDVFNTSLYTPLIEELVKVSNVEYSNDANKTKLIRIIADHVKAATIIIINGITPSNKGQGYLLRRLIRRSEIKMKQLKNNMGEHIEPKLGHIVLKIYEDLGFNTEENQKLVYKVLEEEILKFSKTFTVGQKMLADSAQVNAKLIFDLYQSYGFPIEVTRELLLDRGLEFDSEMVNEEFARHRDLSRTTSTGMFKGGLQDHSEATTKYHTATHLLHSSLRKILGEHVSQKGSNITAERLRFDFSHPQKLTLEEIQSIEKMINEKISEDTTVERLEMDKIEALKMGALAFFPEKYPEKTSVYKIGDFSLELCGGPHVNKLSEIGKIRLTKQEQIGAGLQRIYAQLETD
jgi:alanyl-tRNA synthetase